MTKRDEDDRFTIGELAERAGLTRRTVRFYVQKGVLSPPDGAGRGARYSDRHLAQLEAIADAKLRNVTLDRVARSLDGAGSGSRDLELSGTDRARRSGPASAMPRDLEESRWLRIAVASGLELHVSNEEFSATERDALAAALSETLNRLRPDGRQANERKRGK